MRTIRTILAAAGLMLAAASPSLAQSTCPAFSYDAVLTAGQWQACFDAKQNSLGYVPVNRAGDVMQGPLGTLASATGSAGFNVPPGVAPTSPVNGDIWSTTGGLFVRINGATVGPLTGGASTSFAGTSPIGVTFPAGVVTYAFDFTVANVFLAQQMNQGATTTSPGWYAQIAGDTTPRVRVGTNATDVASIAFGPGNATRDTFIERSGVAAIRLGGPDSASPVGQALGTQGASGVANTVGQPFTISGSASTGNACGGPIRFRTTPAGSSGSTQNTQVLAATINCTGGVTIGAPTGGDEGVGTLNATGVYVGGVAVTAAGITALNGDGTATGPGLAGLTLATVNGNVGTFGSSTAILTVTVNGKGLITAAGTAVVIAPAGTLTGTTLASGVTASSLTSGGTTFTVATGYQIGGAATTAHYLRGNGTNYVDSAILAGDLPLGSAAAFGAVKCDNTTITCSAGVITAVGAAAISVAVGTTTIASGTNGYCLYSNSGTLGVRSCIPEPGGRLTLTQNVPVMVATASAQTTLRYDCYINGQVPYYDGTQDQTDTVASCEVTDAMVSAASAGQVVSGQVYDAWWVHGGANRICLAMSASGGGGGGWASDTGGSSTARGTGYSQLDRVTRPYTTNKNAIANCFNGATNYGSVSANQGTYLGTVLASANGQISWTLGASASGGTAAQLGVWNMYNRVSIGTTVTDSGTSYTYTTATTRQARASAGNQIQFVYGVAEDAAQFLYSSEQSIVAALVANTIICIGFDTTSACTSNRYIVENPAALTALVVTSSPNYNAALPLGLHTASANERGDASNANTFDNNGGNTFTGNLRM